MKKIFIIAGEPSGDQHAAHLIEETLQRNPHLHFYGMGGPCMRAAGADIFIDNKELAVVGITEILRHLPAIYRAFQRVKQKLKTDPPHLLILVDLPWL